MIKVKEINGNGEVWRKILNSVAEKYDCGVRFTIEAGQMNFEGDRTCAMEIIKEAKAIVNDDD